MVHQTVELRFQSIVSNYLSSLNIPPTTTMGPLYLSTLYEFYALNGHAPSPAALYFTAERYGRRPHHVRRALFLLRKKLAERDPYTARWSRLGLYPYLEQLFAYMEEHPRR